MSSSRKPKYKFKSKVWLWPTEKAAWQFVNVPKEMSEEIKDLFGEAKRGFGSIPVEVIVGKTSWETSIFPDKKSGQYLLPIKSAVRKAEEFDVGDTISLEITVRL